ncbi:MAG: hypothetical protein OEY89_14340 [Gammaproteobacteria bacterium]|nr:hypothetical protein [Gammaproteobacteria bacterium]
MLKVSKGLLVEYSMAIPPLVMEFTFNPKTLSRTRTITVKTGNAPGTQGGYDFAFPTETSRVAQGVSMEPESFSISILIDATDRMNANDDVANRFGIQPELDTLRTMVEPKTQGPGGVQILSGLFSGGSRAFQRQQAPSVILFIWGTHVLPVFLTSVKVDEQAHFPNLIPYRAEVTLGMQVIEGNNPFYQVEKVRQIASAALNTVQTSISLF